MRVSICGGNWNNGTNAGVFYVNLNNLRSNSNGNIGFRSALPCLPDIIHSWVHGQCDKGKESVSAPEYILVSGEKQKAPDIIYSEQAMRAASHPNG